MTPQIFKKKIWDYYTREGRHGLTWRKTKDPYKILVSEIMLQQTQVDRVLPKYKAFLERFPTAKSLADAPLKDLLALWSGLGYNRRALFLKRAAEYATNELGGKFPKNVEDLQKMPGVGPYTARAIAIISFNQSHPLIETNIRTVYLHEFFPDKKEVRDKDLMPLIEKTLDTERPRDWFYALMDYGVHLKKTLPNPSRRSKHHTAQSKFEGSLRQIRGAIVRQVTAKSVTRKEVLRSYSKEDHERVSTVIETLKKEGFITITKDTISIV